jgi:hypothetical protein
MKKQVAICAVACCLAASGLALGQNQALSPDQRRALELLDALASALPGDSDTARHITWLRESVRRRPNASLPPSSLATLDADLSALTLSRELSEADRKRVVDVVREDLRLKAEYCRAHPDGMAAQVTLRVRTWQPGEKREAPQWRVMYINAPLRGFRAADAFPRFSSPTEMPVPPGVYVLWAQDATDETRRGPDVLVRPGAAVDQRVLEADLLVAPNERP